MPPVSKRSARRDKIVQAAGRLFAYQGYHGTSTRQIAHMANVSENTLFRHFEHKEDLFWSTLRTHSASLEVHRDLLEGIVKCEPPEVVLPKVLELLSDTASYRPELLRLIAVAFLEMRPKAETFIEERLSPALSAISHYLEMNIKGGKLRDLDPATLTTALMMTTLTHAEISRLIDKDKPLLNYQERNRAHTRFWLDMLAPTLPAYPPPVTPIREESRG
jgi:AcrR family transcriptional regulator